MSDVVQWREAEDEFLLNQLKERSKIKARESRHSPFDILVLLTLDKVSRTEFQRLIRDSCRNIPIGNLLDTLNGEELAGLVKEIDQFIDFDKVNAEYWYCVEGVSKALITKDQQSRSGISSEVAREMDVMFSGKTTVELEELQEQIKMKMSSTEVLDTDYWEGCLISIKIWKAKSYLKEYGLATGIFIKQKEEEIVPISTKGRRTYDASMSPIYSTALRDADRKLPIYSQEDMMMRLAEERQFIESKTAQAMPKE